MIALIRLFRAIVASLFKSKTQLEAEDTALREVSEETGLAALEIVAGKALQGGLQFIPKAFGTQFEALLLGGLVVGKQIEGFHIRVIATADIADYFFNPHRLPRFLHTRTGWRRAGRGRVPSGRRRGRS